MDNNKVYFYNNGRGLVQVESQELQPQLMFPLVEDIPQIVGLVVVDHGPSTINFGQTPFKFPPPDGFQPLNAANTRPETVIARPEVFCIYTGKRNPQEQ